MNWKLNGQVAISLLLAKWRQTLVAAIGVTFGITFFITLLSFMSGLNDLLDGLIGNRTPHVRLYNEVQPNDKQPISLYPDHQNDYHFIRSIKPRNKLARIYNYSAITQTLEKDPRILGLAPKTTTQVFYNVGTVDIAGVIYGIDVEQEAKLFMFADYVTQGNFMDLKNVSNSIILGKSLAEKMMVNIGDIIQLTTGKGQQVKLKVVGFFESGLMDFDKTQGYVYINTAQKILGVSNNEITDLQIKLKDITQAPILAKEFAQTFELNAIDIQTANSQFETGGRVRSIISYAVGITLLIVAGFGIYNILNMMIYEKIDSIAILKATGFSSQDVNLIFVMIALSIGIFGGFVGLIGGLSLSYIIDHIPFNTPALPTIKTYPINYNPKFYLIGTIFSLITTYLAGYLPARKASKIDPVVIIRGK